MELEVIEKDPEGDDVLRIEALVHIGVIGFLKTEKLPTECLNGHPCRLLLPQVTQRLRLPLRLSDGQHFLARHGIADVERGLAAAEIGTH